MTTRNGRNQVRKLRRRIEERERRTCITVVLLGAQGKGLDERRAIARGLERGGMNVVIPEDDLPHGVSPALAEEELLIHGDVDLVFLSVDSWGTATEFGQFHDRAPVAHKLRVLVPVEYHPLYGRRGGYLRDLYLNHLSVFGHVYAVGVPGGVPASAATAVVDLLARRYRTILALKGYSTK